jgi:DNA polymerase-3 subunit gamma/tau
MSYVAIARRWRPSTFGEIVGQPHVTRTLENAIAMGRIHHAFLFTGARGVGKTTAARALARALNCEKGPTATPCGVCAACKEILKGASPDVIEIDGASNNSVDDVRELRETVRYLPQHGKYKIYIVDEVHMLTGSAFNALLKTLEEPPPHVVFIFATTEPQKIPETILSRVQRFDFNRIPLPVVVERLELIAKEDGIVAPPEVLRLIARAGDGSMRDAQSLLDQVISFCGKELEARKVADVLGLVDRELLYGMLEGVLAGDADRCLAAIEKVYEVGYELSAFASEMLELVRNATLTVLSPTSERYLDVSEEEKRRLKTLTNGVPPEVFVRSFQVFLDVHEEVSRAPRPRLVLEMAVARLLAIRPAKPVDDVVARLADLERRLRQGGAAAPSGRSGQVRTRAAKSDDEDHPEPEPPRPEPSRPAAEFKLETPPAVEPEVVPAPTQQVPEPPKAPEIPVVAAVDGDVLPPDDADPTSDETAPEDTAAESHGPPPASPGASPAVRYDAFLTWLEAGGVSYQTWVEDSAFVSAQNKRLVVAFPNAFTRTQAELRMKERDPRFAAGIARYFSGASVEIEVRAAGDRGPTRREARATAAAQHKAQVRSEIEANPLTARIKKVLGASLQDVGTEDAP